MPRKKWSDLPEAFGGESYEIPKFSTGEAAEILKMPLWRLQKFVDLQSYRLPRPAQFGSGRGKGKRRMFSTEDLYRVSIANFLLKDGFTPRLVANLLQDIEDKEFIDYDENGEATLGICLVRDPDTQERKIQLFRPDRSRPPKGAYYSLDFGLPMAKVDQGISEALAKQRRRQKPGTHGKRDASCHK